MTSPIIHPTRHSRFHLEWQPEGLLFDALPAQWLADFDCGEPARSRWRNHAVVDATGRAGAAAQHCITPHIAPTSAPRWRELNERRLGTHMVLPANFAPSPAKFAPDIWHIRVARYA